MSKFDFLIFDLDGTLVDSNKDLAASVNLVRKDYGFEPLSLETICSFIGNGIKVLVDKAVPQDDSEAALEKFKIYYGQYLIDTTVTYPQIEEMLNSLDAKKAILSNKPENFSKEIIKRLGLDRYFVQIWGGDSVEGAKKPDPKTVLELVKLTNSDIKKTIMIGDGINDVKVAKAAEISSLAVSYGYTDINVLKQLNPDFVADTANDIVKILS